VVKQQSRRPRGTQEFYERMLGDLPASADFPTRDGNE
jgi:hypothetical protein